MFRKRKRLHSEVDEEEEGDSGELSLTEYLRRKQEESNLTASGGKKKKRVGLPVPALALISIACITVKHNPGREPGIFSHVSMIYLGESKGNTLRIHLFDLNFRYMATCKQANKQAN